MNKYSEDSPIPNWPKKLKKEYFSIYCSPVNQAIIDGLKNRFNDKNKEIQKKAKELYKK